LVGVVVDIHSRFTILRQQAYVLYEFTFFYHLITNLIKEPFNKYNYFILIYKKTHLKKWVKI